MVTPEIRWEIRKAVRQRVGGYFRNVRYQPLGEHCRVCGVPPLDPQADICGSCSEQIVEYGDRLASQVCILTYVKGHQPGGIHQSAWTVRGYKRRPDPVAKFAEVMGEMIATSTLLHGACMSAQYGPWAVVTFVPSANSPGRDHPAAGLARRVAINNDPHQNRMILGLGPGISLGGRTVRGDRFLVPEIFRERIQQQHVLVVEDTWLTGSKVQSAAVTLKDAGAAHVTALCVARWCDYTWTAHKTMLDGLNDPYDAAICPVTGTHCEV